MTKLAITCAVCGQSMAHQYLLMCGELVCSARCANELKNMATDPYYDGEDDEHPPHPGHWLSRAVLRG